MSKRIVVENLRSAYNVGNIIRTADALGRGVIFVGYTARPDHKEVKKTALGAELTIPTMEFSELSDALYYMNTHGLIIVAEDTEQSIPLTDLHLPLGSEANPLGARGLGVSDNQHKHLDGDCFVIVGNEVTGVESETLDKADIISHIPMLGLKESLNVGQAAAIMMREIGKYL